MEDYVKKYIVVEKDETGKKFYNKDGQCIFEKDIKDNHLPCFTDEQKAKNIAEQHEHAKVKRCIVEDYIEKHFKIHSDDKRSYIDIKLVLEYRTKQGYGLSISATYYEKGKGAVCGGQCLDLVKDNFAQSELFQELFDIWDNYHLNHSCAGTIKQEQYLKEHGYNSKDYTYAERCEILKQAGLYEDMYDNKVYTYGHAWLFHPLPETVMNRIIKLLDM